MADLNATPILSICVTTSERVKDLAIKDRQLIFCRDKGKIAFDFGGTRNFYNQIDELSTDKERELLESPVNGKYYFVIDTAVLWTYQDGWIQLTTPPEEILFIGTTLPELGQANTLYVNKQEKTISIWDSNTQKYDVVANKTEYEFASNEDIDSLFLI